MLTTLLVCRRNRCLGLLFPSLQTYAEAIKEMPWKGIVHSNATVANLIRKAEIRVLPAVIVVDDKVYMNRTVMRSNTPAGSCNHTARVVEVLIAVIEAVVVIIQS